MSTSASATNQCELCEREVASLTVHHLVPRSQGKKGEELPTALLCSACHRQLHALYSNRQLARELSSLEELKNDPAMRGFLRWIRKQQPDKRIKVRRMRSR